MCFLYFKIQEKSVYWRESQQCGWNRPTLGFLRRQKLQFNFILNPQESYFAEFGAI